VLEDGFEYESRRYRSLSAIAREVSGTRWNGLLFFGLAERRSCLTGLPRTVSLVWCAVPFTPANRPTKVSTKTSTRSKPSAKGRRPIQSQRHLGWTLVPQHYDDGGFSGGSLDRPALQSLLSDIESGRVDCVVVYKVDRLSRSLLDFARLVDRFDRRSVSFVSVTQQFNTTTSIGRLTLNILLSFAAFERDLIRDRTRNKMSGLAVKGNGSEEPRSTNLSASIPRITSSANKAPPSGTPYAAASPAPAPQATRSRRCSSDRRPRSERKLAITAQLV